MIPTPVMPAGNIVEASMTFAPESGTVALADVTARVHKADGTEIDLTGITSPDTNQFEVEWESDDDDITGLYVIRWESNAPSPRIRIEGAGRHPDGTEYNTMFILIASAFTTP